MLESVVSNKVNNIGPSFNNNCDLSWFESTHLTEVCSSSSRFYRKRYYPTTFEKETNVIVPQSSEGAWKKRRDDEVVRGQLRRSKRFYQQKERRMTRTSCCEPRREARVEPCSQGALYRNRSLSQSNVGMCLQHHQLSVMDDNSDPLRQNTVNRRHLNPNLLHHISSHSPHGFIQGKEAITSNHVPSNINNHCNVQTSHNTASCGLINHFPVTQSNFGTFRQPQQTTRRRHHTSDLTSSYQVNPTSQNIQSRSINIAASQSSISGCTIPNRTLATNTSSFPIVNRSFCQNPNQFRFTTYPINPYTPQHQPMFSRSSVPTTTILPHNSTICSTIQMPTVIGDIISSTPCHQCTIMAGSGINTFSNLSSMFQFSLAPTPTSLITLATVSGDRIHGSRLSYVPVHAINNWHNRHPFLPAAWSYNDLTSIINNSTARHILQDHLAQRLLSTSPSVGIQFVMMTPSSVLGSTDPSQIRHHLIPLSRSDSLSPIAVSRYLPIIHHLPLLDQPKPGITKQELDQIPIKKFVKVDNDITVTEDGKDKCMICLEDFISNEFIRLLKCSHDFHSTCVERWLKINRTCPLCRADVTGHCYGK